jgi:hypothetical protein
MEIRISITKEKIKENAFAIFCWLNVLVGIYFVLESFKEFEPKAAYIFLAWAVLFFLAWLTPLTWKKLKGQSGLAIENQG